MRIGNHLLLFCFVESAAKFPFFHSVWDMYQEDMDEYAARKKEIKKQFVDAGEPLPKELDSSKDVVEEMDPTMKAFLEMEKKLNGK